METDKKQEETADEKPKKVKPKYVLPTPRISFLKQLDLLRAWATTSGTNQTIATTPEVAKVFGIHASTASIANPFFEKTQLLKRSGRGFIPSQEVFAFSAAYKWKPESAAKKLWPAFRETWFAKCLLPKLAFNSLNEVEAINILGEEAGAEKDSRPQLKMLLEFLNAADVIRREGSNILLGSEEGDTQQNGDPIGSDKQKQTPGEAIHKETGIPKPSPSTQGAVQFSINMKVDMAELSGWQPDRITAFFTGLSMVLAAKGEETKSGGQS